MPSETLYLRGCFSQGCRSNSLFHGHIGDGYSYTPPLIQYKCIDGKACIVGLEAGAEALKNIPKIKDMILGGRKKIVERQELIIDQKEFGWCREFCEYVFVMPWMGLNQENNLKYIGLNKNGQDVNHLLVKILTGNILSMSKAVGYTVPKKIEIQTRLAEGDTVPGKGGTTMKGFTGSFLANFIIPDLWGIGKLSSHGYGTVKLINKT